MAYELLHRAVARQLRCRREREARPRAERAYSTVRYAISCCICATVRDPLRSHSRTHTLGSVRNAMENRESFVSSLNLLFDLPPTRHSTHGCAFLRRPVAPLGAAALGCLAWRVAGRGGVFSDPYLLSHLTLRHTRPPSAAHRTPRPLPLACPTENLFLPDALPVEPSNSAAPPIGRTECNLHDGRRSGGGQSSRSLECSKAARNRRYSTSN